MTGRILTPEGVREIAERLSRATPGPWAWEAVGEKSNDWIVGYACTDNDEPLSGHLCEEDFVVDAVIRGPEIGSYEGATANYGDPDFIAHAPEDISNLLATLAAREEECKRHAPLPDREALSLFVESALNVPPKDYLRKGTQAEYIADALLAWLKSSTASQRGADE